MEKESNDCIFKDVCTSLQECDSCPDYDSELNYIKKPVHKAHKISKYGKPMLTCEATATAHIEAIQRLIADFFNSEVI